MIILALNRVAGITWIGWTAISVLLLALGLIVGFFVARAWFKRYLAKNPPVNENMIREMMRQMGRTPSERQVKQILSSMNQHR